MTRRRFVKHILNGAYALMMMQLIKPASLRGMPRAPSGKRLHYLPLNGHSLEEMARKKMHHDSGRFVNPMGLSREGRFWDLIRWKFSPNAFETYLDEQPLNPVAIDWSVVKNHHGLSITFLKHAGITIKDHGETFYIDPVFDDIGFFIKDFTPRRFELAEMPRANHILITHGHYDHLDTRSLQHFQPSTHVITPLGYNKVFQGLKMNNRRQLDWYETVETGKQRVTLLPSNHWTMRNPIVGPNRSLWGAYLIETQGGYTIFVSGDTAYFDGFEQIGSRYDIDLAIFNLGAYEPRWFMAQSHANPSETVQAFIELNAKHLMIVHWGTFQLGDEPVHFPPRDIKMALEQKEFLNRLIDVKHGDSFFVD